MSDKVASTSQLEKLFLLTPCFPEQLINKGLISFLCGLSGWIDYELRLLNIFSCWFITINPMFCKYDILIIQSNLTFYRSKVKLTHIVLDKTP